VSRRLWLLLGGGLVLALLLAALLFHLTRPKPPPRLTLVPARYDQLTGWGGDNLAAALPALLRSCAAFLARPDPAALDDRIKSGDFGTVSDWRAPCAAAALVPAHDDGAARRFFETEFRPLLAGNNGDSEGLFTGYFELTLNGARHRGGPFQTPLYRRPPEALRHYDRGAIEDGALEAQGLELLWVDDPVAAFFLEIQGSGRVKLKGGGMLRVGYDGSNGKPYVAVGRLLVERGVMAKEDVTMASIVALMKAHPAEGAALRRENPAFVYFREVAGDGPLGAERVVLTAGRSLAVDRAFIPLGLPIWLEAKQRYAGEVYRRLVVAQDAGGAIKGPVRGDLFWGHGKAAADGAGGMNARGRYYLLCQTRLPLASPAIDPYLRAAPKEGVAMAEPARIGLLVTCLVDLFRPSVGFAAVKLLEDCGCTVEVPRQQTCCGQPAYNSGDRGDAKALARQVIAAFSGYDYVVAPSGSCAGMVKLHYPRLFADEPETLAAAEALAARTWELIAFLVEVRGVERVSARWPRRTTYHDGCSGLRELGVKAQPRRLLRSVAGLDLTELPGAEVCCGFGGTFCVKYPEISDKMVADKAADIAATGADAVLAGDLGCLLNIAGKLARQGSAVETRHVAEVLAGMADDLPAIGAPRR
jgi:membrane-bound lytic murein transglycosylase/Fe-S oxidoreductase